MLGSGHAMVQAHEVRDGQVALKHPGRQSKPYPRVTGSQLSNCTAAMPLAVQSAWAVRMDVGQRVFRGLGHE